MMYRYIGSCWEVVLDENDPHECAICNKPIAVGDECWIQKTPVIISCIDHVRPGNVSSTVPITMDKKPGQVCYSCVVVQ